MPPVRKKRDKPYGLQQRTVLTAPPPFSNELLRNICLDALGLKYQPPADPELTELCRILNFWHSYFFRAQEERKFNDLAEEAKGAIDTLRRLMPDILEDLRARDAGFNGQDFFLNNQLKHAKAFELCLTPTGTGFLQLHDLPNHAKDWRWLIEVLPIDIKNALLPLNPQYKGGRSKTGPLPKLLSKLIYLITGEEVTEVAVGNQLINMLGPKSG